MIVVFVRWRDASYQRGEVTLEEMTPLIEMTTAGIFVREDDETISIALDYCRRDNTYRSVVHIPKTCIVQRREVRF